MVSVDPLGMDLPAPLGPMVNRARPRLNPHLQVGGFPCFFDTEAAAKPSSLHRRCDGS